MILFRHTENALRSADYAIRGGARGASRSPLRRLASGDVCRGSVWKGRAWARSGKAESDGTWGGRTTAWATARSTLTCRSPTATWHGPVLAIPISELTRTVGCRLAGRIGRWLGDGCPLLETVHRQHVLRAPIDIGMPLFGSLCAGCRDILNCRAGRRRWNSR